MATSCAVSQILEGLRVSLRNAPSRPSELEIIRHLVHPLKFSLRGQSRRGFSKGVRQCSQRARGVVSFHGRTSTPSSASNVQGNESRRN